MSKPENPTLFDVAIPEGSRHILLNSVITLRDLFAAFALAGAVANPNNPDPGGASDVRRSFKTADEMLAERERGGEDG